MQNYHNAALDSAHRHHRVVALWPPSRRVYHKPNRLVLYELEGRRSKHDLDVALPEHLLQRVERQAGELGLDEVGAVLCIFYI